MSDPIRGFYIHTESWWHEANKGILDSRGVVENIQWGLYYRDGGCGLSIAADWHDLDNRKPPALRIDVFDDSFQAFVVFKDVFEELGYFDSENGLRTMEKEQFISILVACGFEDLTEREYKANRPKKRKLELED
jgi:hypothetical protein